MDACMVLDFDNQHREKPLHVECTGKDDVKGYVCDFNLRDIK
jgi:hypothetical protein